MRHSSGPLMFGLSLYATASSDLKSGILINPIHRFFQRKVVGLIFARKGFIELIVLGRKIIPEMFKVLSGAVVLGYPPAAFLSLK